MEKVAIGLFTTYGPLALGWVMVFVLAWHIRRMHCEHRRDMAKHAEDLKELTRMSHDAIKNNTEVITALNIRLEEREHG